MTSQETTAAQSLNASLTNSTYSLALGMSQLLNISATSSTISDSLKKSQQTLLDLYVHRLIDPLLTALKNQLDSALERIHLIDWSMESGGGGGSSGSSGYVNELTDRIWNLRERIFSGYEVGDEKKKW